MTIPNRTVSIKSVFASTANTTIPTPPATGISYRNTGTTAAEIGEGWPFKEVVDSAKFNQAMYEYTTICQQLEKYGFLPWSANTDYPAQGCALGSDGKIYQAKRATGPSSTSIDPTTDTSHTYWDLFYYADVTANRALVSNANGKMAASSVTATELGYLSGVTSSIQTQINNKAANNAVVHISGNETIAGTKTFTNGMITDNIIPQGDITLGTSTTTWGKQLQFRDTTGKRIARIQPMAIDTTNNRVGMWVNNADNTVEKGIYVDSDGTTSAPTPTAGDNSTKIATTSFVQTAVNTRATQADINVAVGYIFSSLYPVGSLYITTQNTGSCPIAGLISGSQWELVATDRALWGGNGWNAHSWINAGLPNITGAFNSRCMIYPTHAGTEQGALYLGSGGVQCQNAGGTDGSQTNTISFNASRSNSIYGASSTVQPPAYRVNVWRRTA